MYYICLSDHYLSIVIQRLSVNYSSRWKVESLTQCDGLRNRHTHPLRLGERPNEKGSHMVADLHDSR